jgi:hypothetical protein
LHRNLNAELPVILHLNDKHRLTIIPCRQAELKGSIISVSI